MKCVVKGQSLDDALQINFTGCHQSLGSRMRDCWDDKPLVGFLSLRLPPCFIHHSSWIWPEPCQSVLEAPRSLSAHHKGKFQICPTWTSLQLRSAAGPSPLLQPKGSMKLLDVVGFTAQIICLWLYPPHFFKPILQNPVYILPFLLCFFPLTFDVDPSSSELRKPPLTINSYACISMYAEVLWGHGTRLHTWHWVRISPAACMSGS